MVAMLVNLFYTNLRRTSEITLVTRDADIPKYWEIYDALAKLSKDPEIHFIRAENDYLTTEEKEAIAQEMVEL